MCSVKKSKFLKSLFSNPAACCAFDVVQESYAFLTKHDVVIDKMEMERVDSLKFAWTMLNETAAAAHDHLWRIQPEFRDDLIRNVAAFKRDTSNYFRDYEEVHFCYFPCFRQCW